MLLAKRHQLLAKLCPLTIKILFSTSLRPLMFQNQNFLIRFQQITLLCQFQIHFREPWRRIPHLSILACHVLMKLFTQISQLSPQPSNLGVIFSFRIFQLLPKPKHLFPPSKFQIPELLLQPPFINPKIFFQFFNFTLFCLNLGARLPKAVLDLA